MKLPEDCLPFSRRRFLFRLAGSLLGRIRELINGKRDFGFETTPASKGHVQIIKQAKKKGYTVVLIYFWLESSDLARARVKARVEKGGHDIAPVVIDRRYKRGLKNFFSNYQGISDSWVVYDNSSKAPVLVAKGNSSVIGLIKNVDLWTCIQHQK